MLTLIWIQRQRVNRRVGHPLGIALREKNIIWKDVSMTVCIRFSLASATETISVVLLTFTQVLLTWCHCTYSIRVSNEVQRDAYESKWIPLR